MPFIFYCCADHRDLHSFPTRRSSDLRAVAPVDASTPVVQLLAEAAIGRPWPRSTRSEEHTSELQSRFELVCRLLLEKKKTSSAARRSHPFEQCILDSANDVLSSSRLE